jgi:hypothetical protein
MANAVIRRRDECNDRATGADLSPKRTFAVNLFHIGFYAFSFRNAGELRRFPRAAHGRAPAEARDRAYPGISTTIHSQRPFGKISITNPEVVDLVLQTDKSAVLIPERLGRTNVDFLDDNGSIIGSMDIVVTQQSATDRVVVYDHPTLGAYSTYHCGPGACAHFEEIPAKEQALAPGAPSDHGMPGIPGMPGMPPQ